MSHYMKDLMQDVVACGVNPDGLSLLDLQDVIAFTLAGFDDAVDDAGFDDAVGSLDFIFDGEADSEAFLH